MKKMKTRKKNEELINSKSDYNIIKKVKNNYQLTQKEIDEWNRIKCLPKWKRTCMEILHITEKEYDERKRNINTHFRSSSNINKIKCYGPYTIRGINDYNNNIKLFPFYRFSQNGNVFS